MNRIKVSSQTSIGSAALVAALFLATSASLSAAGTAAGTSISNQASIAYQVGGVAQTPVTSNSLAFLVDQKVNLTVATTDSAAVTATPGGSGFVLSFTVQNTGNELQDFALSTTARSGGTAAFGGTDNNNAASVAVFVESGATAGYQSAQDLATFVDEIAANGTRTVYIVGSFASGTYANGDIASYHLLAQARAGGTASSLGAALTQTSGADTASVDIVFADGQGSDTTNDAVRDARFSDDSDFAVSAASLTVTKASAVISDPSNSTSNPKAIPGAVIEYTITIANAASAATATNVTFSDSLNAEITATTLAFVADAFAAGRGVRVTAPNINSGAATNLTNVGSDDQGDWNTTGTNTVTVSGITLAASESATIKFRVTIQ